MGDWVSGEGYNSLYQLYDENILPDNLLIGVVDANGRCFQCIFDGGALKSVKFPSFPLDSNVVNTWTCRLDENSKKTLAGRLKLTHMSMKDCMYSLRV